MDKPITSFGLCDGRGNLRRSASLLLGSIDQSQGDRFEEGQKVGCEEVRIEICCARVRRAVAHCLVLPMRWSAQKYIAAFRAAQ